MTPTPALGPVLVGVNGSHDSNRAVDWAADYAVLGNRALVALHGLGFVGVRPDALDLLEAEQEALAAGEVIVRAAVERARSRHPGLEAEGHAELGDPPAVLLEAARSAALVVVGARRGGAGKRIFGSVGLTAARHATCPAVVVRPPKHGAATPSGERIVLGVDGSPASVDAARFAFGYADLSGLPVLVVHASWERLEKGSAVLGLLTDPEDRRTSSEEELATAETIAGLPEDHPDVEYREIHRTADPAEALLEASATARLVVVGSHRRGGLRSVLQRSVATALVEHAACPVAVVPPEG